MGARKVTFAVFTKPWKMPLPELGKFVHDLGFDGIEFPVRGGYQVEPENIGKGLPDAAKILADCGVKICSIAGPTDEVAIAACQEAGVPIIRICLHVPKDETYMQAESDWMREYDELVPLLERHGVTIGIQNHCGNSALDAMYMRHLIEKYDPKQIAAVWDAGHSGLCGEEPRLGLDIVWSHLCMVNLKNAFWMRSTGPEAEDVKWKSYWTSGRQGMSSWPEVAKVLKERNYCGPVCLTAEYSDHDSVNRLIAEDIAFAKPLFE
ncbi:MAG TPA: sugar phosphate isomerase/epimerase family protein [Candidatus Brocadiia bacterium]|nr:sugar phosphate isomerase/epimerase family protein [Candidatus Brocadiia bacterium]